jgi:hypothetical protein
MEFGGLPNFLYISNELVSPWFAREATSVDEATFR